MSLVIADVFRWGDARLQRLDYCDFTDATITVADSFLVSDGSALALDLHRTRFLTSVPRGYYGDTDPDAFWRAAIAAIPREGDWFPRLELHDGPRFLFRHRSAPQLKNSIVLTTHRGADPRTTPGVKGPDFAALTRVRTEAQTSGADEAVLLTDDGYVIESSQSAIVWWRGSILCTSPSEFERVDSVTAKAMIGLAAALGIELHTEAVTPAELDGTEVWALNSLHGPRIVTRWIDGPELAELPGRLTQWRARLAALRHPLPPVAVAE